MTKTRVLESPLGTNTNHEPKRLSLFESITKGRVRAPRRVLLYGLQGVGKSTWAAQAPNAIFLPTEEGVNDIDVAKFPILRSYTEFNQALKELYTEKHDFKTIVIDSLDWLEQMVWDETLNEYNRAHPNKPQETISGVEFGQGYVLSLGKWRTLLSALDTFRAERGMMTILLAHSKVEPFKDPEKESYDRHVPHIHRSVSALIQEWSDEVLFACYKTYTTEVKEQFGRTRVQGIGEGERILRTSERPFCMAKNRLNLPFEMPLDWKEYEKFLSA